MDSGLDILLIEDSPEDIDLIQRVLTRGNLEFYFRKVDDEKKFLAAVEEKAPDIVLCDHSLPDFNSLEALKLFLAFQEKLGRRIPFILVTGTVSEEFAAHCIQAGADDFILKDRLRRLPEAIRNAIRKCKAESEREEYTRKVISREALMKEAETLAHLGTWKVWLNTGRARWSDGAYRIFGYEPGSMTPTLALFFGHVHPDDRPVLSQQIEHVVATGKPAEAEFRVLDKGGNERFAKARTVFQTENGGDPAILGFVYDITDQKRAESQLEQVYRLARIGVWQLNVADKRLVWSDVTREIHERDANFVPTLDACIDCYKEGDSRTKIMQAVERAVQSGEGWDLELELITGKGHARWVRDIGRPMARDRKTVAIYGMVQDIDLRKRAQLHLEEQNKRLVEIAWTQSHEVRGPLANLLGLTHLLKKDRSNGTQHETLERLDKAARELDQIVKRVVRLTEEELNDGARDPES